MRQPNPTANRFKFKCDRIYIDVFINRCRRRAEIIQAGPIGPNKISSSNHHHHHQPPSSTTRNAIANAQHRACRRINLIQMLGCGGVGWGFSSRNVRACSGAIKSLCTSMCVCVFVCGVPIFMTVIGNHTRPNPRRSTPSISGPPRPHRTVIFMRQCACVVLRTHYSKSNPLFQYAETRMRRGADATKGEPP